MSRQGKSRRDSISSLSTSSKGSLQLSRLCGVRRGLDALRASAILGHPEESHHARLGEYAARLYRDKAMTDVMVVVQGHEFKAHKAVLACYSPYFKEVLVRPGFNDVHYVMIPSVTSGAFEILLEYMYSGELRLTCQEHSDVYRAARRLGMADALATCVDLMHVTPESYDRMVYLYVTARKLNMLDSSVRAFRLLLKNFEHMIMTREFLDLEVAQVIDLFSADQIGARSEVIVFLGALKWLNHHFLEREQFVALVMGCVRFALMNTEEVLACHHPPVLSGIVHFRSVKEALLNATCYISAKSIGQEYLFAEIAGKPRKFLFLGEPMVLWDVSIFDNSRYVTVRQNSAATCIQAAFRGYMTRKFLDEDIRRAHSAATAIQAAYRGYRTRSTLLADRNSALDRGDKIKCQGKFSYPVPAHSSDSFRRLEPIEDNLPIYMVGGIDMSAEGEGGANALLCFNPEDERWSVLSTCPEPLLDCRMVSLKGSLYLIGGCNPTLGAGERMEPLASGHQFELRSRRWSRLPAMHHARYYHGAAALNGSIYAAGGKDRQHSFLATVEEYDATRGRWREAAFCLPEPRMGMGFAAHDGSLWMAGGVAPHGPDIVLLDSVHCMDTRVGRWMDKCCLPQPMAFPCLLSYGDRLLCVGGATRSDSSATGVGLVSQDHIYAYEGKLDAWTLMTSMPVQCHKAVVCASGTDLYVLGGFSTQLMSDFADRFSFSGSDGRWQRMEKAPSAARDFISSASVA